MYNQFKINYPASEAGAVLIYELLANSITFTAQRDLHMYLSYDTVYVMINYMYQIINDM